MMAYFKDIEFAHPQFFWLLLSLPLLAVYIYWKKNQRMVFLHYSSLTFWKGNFKTFKSGLLEWFFLFRLFALFFLIVAMARPQKSSAWQDVTTEGIDIILSVDISTSMLAEDFKPNRLESSKNIAIDFIEGRPNDRIGLVVFSGESFTQCPLTTDHDVLKNLFRDIRCGMLSDGTAIGSGLGTSVSRLKESTSKSKVIILLTDGSNNTGSISPLDAAKIAQTFGVRVYTIGVGTEGMAPYPFKDPFGRIVYQNVKVEIDEKLLSNIAEQTGGKYFRAKNNNALKKIYQEIDTLEKTKFQVHEFKNKQEAFFPWILMGFGLLIIEFMLKYLFLKSVT